MTDDSFAPPPRGSTSASTTRARLLGAASIALGLWTGCGGCFGALGALGAGGGSDGAPPPLLSPAQAAAAERLAEAAAAYAPVDGGLSLVAGIAGFGLIAAGVLSLARGPASAGPQRAAFVVSAVVDGAQLLWMLAWFALLWQPFTDYTLDVAATVGDGSVDTESVVGAALGLVVLLGALYYAAKVGAAALGAALSGTRQESAEAEALTDWAD
jgi:hypothetical protein